MNQQQRSEAGARVRRWLIGATLFVVVWMVSVVAGAAVQSPFTVAVEAAAEQGGWPVESVRMRRGSYTALPFVFWAEAEVVATTPRGEEIAEVSLTHIPLLNYHSVYRFRRSARVELASGF